VHPDRGLVRRVRVGEPLHAVDVAGDPGRGPLDCVVVPLSGIDRLRCLGLEVRAAARLVEEELDPGRVGRPFGVVNLRTVGRRVVVGQNTA
jgi:hypothetical protein